MKHKPLPPLEELREALDYNPDTGIITWRKSPARRVKAGQEAGTKLNRGYRHITFKQKPYLTHRLAYYIYHGIDPLENQLDHKNGNRLDNTIKNLRLATHADNGRNRGISKKNTSGVTGVHWNKKKKKWEGYIRINGKQKYLGYFDKDKKQEAIQSRIEAEKKYFGDYRRHGL